MYILKSELFDCLYPKVHARRLALLNTIFTLYWYVKSSVDQETQEWESISGSAACCMILHMSTQL